VTRLLFVVGLVALFAACSTSDPVIDGWSIGRETGCPRGATTCDDFVQAGLKAFDERDPAHPAVARWEIHAEGVWYDPKTGTRALRTMSGSCCDVLVLRLEDGTTAAIGVGYPGISQEPVGLPWGPAKRSQLGETS
jgi:hypothetical protein